MEWAQVQSGPVAGQMLADLGAEVIKIEPPVTGDQSRGMQTSFDTEMKLPGGNTVQFESFNRNKKCIVLDFKKDKGREVLYQLVKKSDVFLTNYRRSVAKELGADYSTLRQHNPKLVYALGSSYGSSGQWSDRRGYDLVGQALSGAMYAAGDRDDTEPSIITGGVMDQIEGTLLAFGILGALLETTRSAVGQEIETSLLAAGMHLQLVNVNSVLWRNRPMARHSRKRSRSPLANFYLCADGKWLLLCEIQSGRYWHDFCQAVGIQRLENDPRFNSVEARVESRSELIGILDKIFAGKSRDEWLKMFEGHDFVYAPVYDLPEAVTEPQMMENGYIIDMQHPVMGQTRCAGFPVKYGRTPAALKWSAPEYGQHTEEVLSELLGYDWEQLGKMNSEGVTWG